MHDAVAELGVVGDLAQARARVAELAERAQGRLGELVAALVELVGGCAASRLGGAALAGGTPWWCERPCGAPLKLTTVSGQMSSKVLTTVKN